MFAPMAHANQYEIFELSCRLTGTQEDLSMHATALPKALAFKARFAKLLGTPDTIPQSKFIQILDPQGQRMATPAFEATAETMLDFGYGHKCPDTEARLTLELKPADPAVVRQFLLEMGARQLPELARSESLSEGKVAFQKLTLGTSDCEPYRKIDTVSEGVLSQIHFDYSTYNGLSYHLRLERCSLRYLDPRKISSGRRGE